VRFRALFLTILILPSTVIGGCYRNIERHVVAAELPGSVQDHVLSATLRDGSRIVFLGNGAVYEWREVAGRPILYITGMDADRVVRTIEVADIVEARVRSRKTDGARSVMLAAVIFCVGAVIEQTALHGYEVD
jgi:hypothetical protein